MTTRSFTSINKAKRTELDGILTVWENRYKLRVLSKNLPRAIIVGLIITMIIGVVGYWQQMLYAQTLAMIALVICGLLALLTVLYTHFFPRQRQAAAQYFDIEFHLQERMSTALEILDGRIHTHPEIEAMQLADSLRYAQEIDPQRDIQMDFRPREMTMLMILLVGVLAMIIIPLIIGQAPIAERPSAAVRAAQEEVREITETIATDTNLDEIDRQELLNALEIALERLQEEDISDEEAFAAMSQLESQIEEVQNQLEETMALDQSALESAQQSLSEFTPPPEPDDSNTEDENNALENSVPTAEQLQQALDQMAQDAQTMSAEEAQSAADALRQAAQELMESNPELAQALQDAADALENGDSEAMQQQLENAQQQLDQQQQQMQRNSNSQQMLQDQSEMAQSAANEISEQQSQQQQNQQSQESQQGDQGQQSDSQEGQPGQAESSDSQQQGENPGNQPGDQPSDSSQPGNTQGGQQPNSNQPGQTEGEGQSENSDASGQGAGEGEASNTSISGGGSEDQGADTDNQTTGEQQIEYEAIYNPTGINGGGDNEIELQTDASDQSLAEGEFDDNPLGQSQVSYDTVFSDYQDAANRALESDYVPLGLRDVVRDYFTSLEPTGGE